MNALRAFEAASRHSSFTSAAQELFITQGAVSRHVATLESWLEVQLFSRNSRGIELTPKGRTARLRCEALVDGKVVLDGEAVVSVPPRSATRSKPSSAA